MTPVPRTFHYWSPLVREAFAPEENESTEANASIFYRDAFLKRIVQQAGNGMSAPAHAIQKIFNTRLHADVLERVFGNESMRANDKTDNCEGTTLRSDGIF
jgi:hypothetical protein